MEQKYCIFCMNPSEERVCRYCGRDSAEHQDAPHHLQPGTILNNKYQVGTVLGEGGFGITYIGRDITLDMKIAIKEYFPSGIVNRNHTCSSEISAHVGKAETLFDKGKDSFLKEARTLAKFSTHESIVSVRDFFEENNTAYIAMEYLEGTDLKDYLAQRGKLDFKEMYSLLAPVMRALDKIHSQGLIHRDISPSNIMILKDGSAKLLDFGAARDVSGTDEKSLSILLKPGYAPEEQYRTRGHQGTWTDVYALSATIYRILTGITPEDAMNRVFSDEVRSICALNPAVTPEQEAVIFKGMAVQQADRYQTIAELQAACEACLRGEKSAVLTEGKICLVDPVAVPKNHHKHTLAIGIVVAAVAALIAAVVLVGVTISKNRAGDSDEEKSAAVSEEEETEEQEEEEESKDEEQEEETQTEQEETDAETVEEETAAPEFVTICGEVIDIDETYLAFHSETITNEELEQLKYLTALEDLTLYDCALDNASVELLSDMTRLKWLNLTDNPGITDVSCLDKLTDLISLRISGTGVTDLSVIANYTELQYLYIAELPEPDITTLTLPAGLKGLDCSSDGITDLSFLETANTLAELSAANNSIQDIAVLADFPSLYSLNLENNLIFDITVLADLDEMMSLHLSCNQIEDISALTNLSDLTYLYLAQNKITDISPIQDCFRIEILDISCNAISDISPLITINALESLELHSNPLADISPLAECRALASECFMLDISNNAITSLEALSGYDSLLNLYASHNQITDVTPLAECDVLEYIELNDNQVSDASALAGLSNLEELQMIDNPIASVEALPITDGGKCNYSALGISYHEEIDWQKLYDAGESMTAIFDVPDERTKDALREIGFRYFSTAKEWYAAEEEAASENGYFY